MVQKNGFHDYRWNPDGNFPNEFETQTLNGVTMIIDHATKLMWQQSGSSGGMQWNDTENYIKQLNQEQFAGYSDWRLPTIEELASLIEPKKQSNGL